MPCRLIFAAVVFFWCGLAGAQSVISEFAPGQLRHAEALLQQAQAAAEEGDYAPVYYFPRKDVRMERLSRTAHHTYCPFKGTASYFSLKGGAENAVWTYETPYDEMLAIKELVAFYSDKVESISHG